MEGGGLIRETKIPVQELWPKIGGGLIYARGGVFTGHCGNYVTLLYIALQFHLFWHRSLICMQGVFAEAWITLL